MICCQIMGSDDLLSDKLDKSNGNLSGSLCLVQRSWI